MRGHMLHLPNWIITGRQYGITIPYILDIRIGEWNGIMWFWTVKILGFGYTHTWTKKKKDWMLSDKRPFG